MVLYNLKVKLLVRYPINILEIGHLDVSLNPLPVKDKAFLAKDPSKVSAGKCTKSYSLRLESEESLLWRE